MDAIREKYEQDAQAQIVAIPGRWAQIDSTLTQMATDTKTLTTNFGPFAVTPSDSGPVPTNTHVAEALERAQTEIMTAVTAFENIQAWLLLSVPSSEKSSPANVQIIMEAAKLVGDSKKALTDELKALPEYYKERSACAAALSPKVSVTVSETSSKSSDDSTAPDKETKAVTTETTSKSGTSKSTKQDSSTSTSCADATAHLVALDVSAFQRAYAQLDRVKTAYAVVADYLEKNSDRISEPKGRGSGMSMF
mmetsp:Transcript_65881/g.148670  ORF Transcript_65881/g.148670 Transcript_65881/m.148670 type:complete len:251 (+) Transcript_65881:45-797(+)